MGAGKIQLNSIVDIAIMQSLNRAGNIRECVKNYGMIIVDDIVACHEKSKNILVLTGRVAHVEDLTNRLKPKIPDIIPLTGGMGVKHTEKELKKISKTPMNKPITLVSTGKFIGEGFDEPRLDTLFMAMPVAWKGTVQQYAGRLHRLWENKNEVAIYDYVDVHVPVLEKMYGKRLKGYASIGYRAKVENIVDSPKDIIFDNHSFLPVYLRDMAHALKDILIVTPFVTARRVTLMMDCFTPLLAKQLPITILTRPAGTFPHLQKEQLTLIFNQLTDAGIILVFKPHIHQKFAIIDQKIVWYGSINLLGFGKSQESIMRLISTNIAQELSRTIKPRQA